jgi:hypothetical protein
MEQLLSMIALWLSVNFGLPSDGPMPKVKFLEPVALTQLWTGRIARNTEMTLRELKRETSQIEVQAFYDDSEQTIFVGREWKPASPKQLSILVHEMVHHLQNLDKRRFACPAERERLAYKAQNAWLGLFQTSLETEFGIDRFTLHVSTRCMH